MAVNQRLPFSGRVKAAENIHQRALARTGRAHDGHPLALLHRKSNAAESRNFSAVFFRQITNFNEWQESILLEAPGPAECSGQFPPGRVWPAPPASCSPDRP